jgi:diguanylate cyclase (GGDEF)-like protein
MLDHYSIMVSQILNQAIITSIMFTIWKDNKDRVPGLNYWMLNLVFQTLGQALLPAAEKFSSPILGVIGNTCILTGAIFFYFGLAEFNGTTVRKKGYYLYISIFFILSVGLSLIFKHTVLKTLLFNIAVLLIFIQYLKIMLQKQDRWYRKTYLSLGVLYIVFSTTYLLRIINLLTSLRNSSEEIIINDSRAALLLFIASLLLTIVNYIIIILINRSLIQELKQDAVERDEMLVQMKQLAETDSLTGLANRMTIDQQILKELRSKNNPESACAVILIDLDNFKHINDTFGHDEGDRVLIKTADILQNEFNETPHTAGRWGGDEFILIVRKASDKSIVNISEQILKKFRNIISAKNYHITVSIGWSRYTNDDTLSSLLKRADINLYRAKSSGKDKACSDLSINQANSR